jgi:hypothetical protein
MAGVVGAIAAVERGPQHALAVAMLAAAEA